MNNAHTFARACTHTHTSTLLWLKHANLYAGSPELELVCNDDKYTCVSEKNRAVV